MTDEKTEDVELCADCGKPDNSFACKIRHQTVAVVNLKRQREAGIQTNFGFTENR